MRIRTRVAAAASIALVAAALAGCNPPLPDEAKSAQNGPKVYGDLVERTVGLQDGREILCLFWTTNGSVDGGISCDWEGAER